MFCIPISLNNISTETIEPILTKTYRTDFENLLVRNESTGLISV